MSIFQLVAPFKPTGDQPRAIEKLAENLQRGATEQTLLGVTGSGKTFTIANVIAKIQQPTLVISPNKTLAAQLYQEFKEFFPENAVHYFVSYYDYYQPEAYLPQSDTYIEKDAKINDTIDALRHASTASILTRRDVIIVASVSCIYGVGDPEEYQHVAVEFAPGDHISQKALLAHLVSLHYSRNPLDPRQGNFRVRENTIEIYLPSGEEIIALELDHGGIISIKRSSVSKRFAAAGALQTIRIFPAKHFVTPKEKLHLAVSNIRRELREQLATLQKQNKILEAARLKQRTEFDLATLVSTGYVSGIENYSRHLSFRQPGSPPHTLIDYLRYAYPDGFLTVLDESHVTIPQLRGMERGDAARKQTLINYGFRLPSARDNRPLTFDEFNEKINKRIYVSATPGPYELRQSQPHIIEQLIRPTGILDPEIEVRPTQQQMQHVISEIKNRIAKNERSLVMALTKRLAEDIADYLKAAGIRAEYLHSEIKTLERPEALRKLRDGMHDVLVGINLLREGLDLPEVSLICVLDADKEGFLRNETTLLQIIGRAARHADGKVILYADTITGSMKSAISETNRRRNIQDQHNRSHDIIPQGITKEIRASLLEGRTQSDDAANRHSNTPQLIAALEKEMKKAAKELNFELAAKIRNRIRQHHTQGK